MRCKIQYDTSDTNTLVGRTGEGQMRHTGENGRVDRCVEG